MKNKILIVSFVLTLLMFSTVAFAQSQPTLTVREVSWLEAFLHNLFRPLAVTPSQAKPGDTVTWSKGFTLDCNKPCNLPIRDWSNWLVTFKDPNGVEKKSSWVESCCYCSVIVEAKYVIPYNVPNGQWSVGYLGQVDDFLGCSLASGTEYFQVSGGGGDPGSCQITATSCYDECIENRGSHEVKCMEGSCPLLWTNIGDYGCSGFPPCTKCCCDLITPCECSDWTKQGCNVPPCAPGHMTYTRSCNPDECSQEYKCEIDSSCPSGECEPVSWIDPVECGPSNNQAGAKCHGDKIISCNLYDGPVYCWTLVQDCKQTGQVCIDYGTVEHHDAECVSPSGEEILEQYPWLLIVGPALLGYFLTQGDKNKKQRGLIIGGIVGFILYIAYQWYSALNWLQKTLLAVGIGGSSVVLIYFLAPLLITYFVTRRD